MLKRLRALRRVEPKPVVKQPLRIRIAVFVSPLLFGGLALKQAKDLRSKARIATWLATGGDRMWRPRELTLTNRKRRSFWRPFGKKR